MRTALPPEVQPSPCRGIFGRVLDVLLVKVALHHFPERHALATLRRQHSVGMYLASIGSLKTFGDGFYGLAGCRANCCHFHARKRACIAPPGFQPAGEAADAVGVAISHATLADEIDPGARIVRHVFTAEPATVADLHQSDLRLHVLAPVKIKGETVWYSAPLNTVGV